MTESRHLDEIMTKQNRVANLQVVFADIEKYSKRRTLTQTEIIDEFTSSLSNAIVNTSKEFITYTQKNNVNFQTDIITIPTGDGAATVFSFDGLSNIHLFFAKSLLEEIDKVNASNPCDKYQDLGWCNCHSNFGIRIGISEGKGVIYRDINDNYNVAGSVINIASRVMGLADKNQIIFTEQSYHQIIDMVDDPNLVDHFVEFTNVQMKHNIQENVYQYIGTGESFLNRNIPEKLGFMQRADKAMDIISSTLGFPRPRPKDIEAGMKTMVGMMEGWANSVSAPQSDEEPKQITEIQAKTDEDE